MMGLKPSLAKIIYSLPVFISTQRLQPAENTYEQLGHGQLHSIQQADEFKSSAVTPGEETKAKGSRPALCADLSHLCRVKEYFDVVNITDRENQTHCTLQITSWDKPASGANVYLYITPKDSPSFTECEVSLPSKSQIKSLCTSPNPEIYFFKARSKRIHVKYQVTSSCTPPDQNLI